VAEPWMIDELAHAGPEHLDPAFVAGYDRKQGYPDPTADLAIFEAHGLDGTSAVLDFASGSGQFALPAARRSRPTSWPRPGNGTWSCTRG